jgi:DNA-binding PucR family transcriptional regulator
MTASRTGPPRAPTATTASWRSAPPTRARSSATRQARKSPASPSAASRSASGGLRGLRHITDLATLTAVDAYPQLGAALADTFLAGLDPAKDFHRLLAQTALAYLDHGCNADATGAALHVHPNTVKHRLRRFGEFTAFGAAGGQGESVTDAMRWWWALDAWLRLWAS